MSKEVHSLILVSLLVLSAIEVYLILSINKQEKCAYNAKKQVLEVNSNKDVWVDFIIETNEVESIYVEPAPHAELKKLDYLIEPAYLHNKPKGDIDDKRW